MPNISIEKLQDRLAAARGDKPADLLLKGGQMVNVYTGSITPTSLAIYDGVIVGFGDYQAKETCDLKGAYLTPGLIESHIHIESSKLTPPRFAEVTVPQGTTTVIADPHEIANVWGLDGIQFMLDASLGLPQDIFYMLPSCVPATDMETAGAVLRAEDLQTLLSNERILGLGEMMNFPGAFLGSPEVLSKILTASGRPVDGHAPGLSGRNLTAYMLAGPTTDHECSTLAEAQEKLALGMHIMLRQGSAAKNLNALLPLLNDRTERRMMLVSDDRRAGDLLNEGHLDHILRLAVQAGVPPLIAIRMVTLNPADAYGFSDRGGLKPGAVADLVAFEDLKDFKPWRVWKNGLEVAREGKLLKPNLKAEYHPARFGKLNLTPTPAGFFKVADIQKPVRVIEIIPDQIMTRAAAALLKSSEGWLKPDVERDIIKLAVIERYTGRGSGFVGWAKGFGLKSGALGSTVAHDSHNIIVTGSNDSSMATAVNRLIEIGGGQVVVKEAKIIAELPLPVGGLMSDQDAAAVAELEEKLARAAGELGCGLSEPFMTLSFLALPVIPELKITDRGYVDVNKFELENVYGKARQS